MPQRTRAIEQYVPKPQSLLSIRKRQLTPSLFSHPQMIRPGFKIPKALIARVPKPAQTNYGDSLEQGLTSARLRFAPVAG